MQVKSHWNMPKLAFIEGQPESLTAQVLRKLFNLLGVPAALGRTFRADEDGAPGSGPVIVLNYGLWQRKFASDPHVLSKSVLLNAQGFTAIGVAPRGFQGATVIAGLDIWVPVMLSGPECPIALGVNANAPAAFGIMALILALIGLVAIHVPARHAAAVDPIIAMRNG